MAEGQLNPVGSRTGYMFVASPYTHHDKAVMEQRFLEACAFTAWLTKNNYTVYCPVISWHTVASLYDLPTDFTFWKENSRRFLQCASKLVILRLDGWLESKGVAYETLYSASLFTPIWFADKIDNGDYAVRKQHENLPD